MSAVGAAVMFAARPRAGAVIVALVVALGVAVSAGAALRGAPARHAKDAVTVAQYLRDRARPGDSAYVMYAYASVCTTPTCARRSAWIATASRGA